MPPAHGTTATSVIPSNRDTDVRRDSNCSKMTRMDPTWSLVNRPSPSRHDAFRPASSSALTTC